jgi:hypothetical protein
VLLNVKVFAKKEKNHRKPIDNYSVEELVPRVRHAGKAPVAAGVLDAGPTLYTDGWPSRLCAVIRVTFSTCNLGAVRDLGGDASKAAGFSSPGHSCIEILDVFSSGNVSVAQPPLLEVLPASSISLSNTISIICK